VLSCRVILLERGRMRDLLLDTVCSIMSSWQPCRTCAKSAIVLAKLEIEAAEEVGVEHGVVDSLCNSCSFSKPLTLPALLRFISHLETVF